MATLEARVMRWEKNQQHSGHWILHQKGLTPTQRRAQRVQAEDHIQEALWLLAQGVELKINKPSQDLPKITVLHLASHFGKTAEIKQLLKYGANVKSVTKDGMEPWMEAAVMHHKKAVDVLVPVQLKVKLWARFIEWIYPQKDLNVQTELHLRAPKKAVTVSHAHKQTLHVSDAPKAKEILKKKASHR